MGWSGGTYTKGNSSTGGWSGDSALGIGIEAGRHDTQDDDFTTGINTCLTKDGQNSATADLPMGGFKHTNVANATARNSYAAAGQVQDQAFMWGGTSGGSANAQTITLTPAITAYTAGQRFRFLAGFTPTAAVTLNVNGVGAKNIISDQVGQAIGNLGFYKGQSVEVVYDGTDFRQVQANNVVLANYNAGATARTVNFYKSRGAEYPTNTIVASGDPVGVINFWGANGTGYDRAAYIAGEIDGTPGASSDMPGRLLFATASDGSATANERMRIDNVGNVGIAGTSVTSRLFVKGEVTTNTRWALAVADSASTDLLLVRCDGAINTGTKSLSPYNNTTGSAANMFVSSAGDLQRSTSSLKYKTDVQDAPFGLADVLKLRPVTYKGKNDGELVFGGLIAEEVDAAGLSQFVQYADDGSPDALAYGNMVSLAFKAIQELHAKVVSLESRVAELEA